MKLKLPVQFDICCRTGLIQRSLTEAKRNWTFALRQRTNSRQSAVSLIQFTYDLVFSTPRDEESSDLSQTPRVYLHRANMLMPLLRLMRSRATELFKWAMIKCIISTILHRERRFTRRRRLSLLVRPTRSGSPRPQSIK